MDINGSGGVYAAEKIIRKRYKKVNFELSIDTIDFVANWLMLILCYMPHRYIVILLENRHCFLQTCDGTVSSEVLLWSFHYYSDMRRICCILKQSNGIVQCRQCSHWFRLLGMSNAFFFCWCIALRSMIDSYIVYNKFDCKLNEHELSWLYYHYIFQLA